MTVNATVCSNITKFRKESQLSQEALASKLGVTFQAVSKWENCLSCPDISLIPLIADIFHISIDTLFGRIEKETVQKWKIEDNLVDWPDDDNLYAVIFQGHRLLKEYEIDDSLSEIQLQYDGLLCNSNIQSHFSVRIDGDVHNANISANQSVNCADIANSNLTAGVSINSSDIYGSNIHAGVSITCSDIIEAKEVSAGTNINAANITCDTCKSGM